MEYPEPDLSRIVGRCLVKKFGFPDAVGIVAAGAAVIVMPGLVDPLTQPKVLVLAAGGLLLLPVAVWRWASQPRSIPPLVVALAAAVLPIWALISMLATGAPVGVSLFGWWGRGDGILALTGAVAIFLSASSLGREEIPRTITWLMAGGSVAAAVGLLQALGLEVFGSNQVVATMGNPNFAAGYFAMIGVVALGVALAPGSVGMRLWSGALAGVLLILATLTDSVQGPVSFACGAIAVGLVWAVAYRGRWRAWALSAAAAVSVIGLGLLVASFSGVGPIARLWQERTFEIRQQYWQTGWNILSALPIFGTGPDGFARYVSEYRPESYLEMLGPTLRVSAAHNIPLNIGATLGWPALLLWCVVMLGALGLLIAGAVRRPAAGLFMMAGVAGGLVAYLVQGTVSIDMIPVLATGWVLAGLALGFGRAGPTNWGFETPKGSSTSAGGSRRRGAQKTHVVSRGYAPGWTWAVGGLLALVSGILVTMQIANIQQTRSISDQVSAVDYAQSWLTPCTPRYDVSLSIVQQLSPEVALPALAGAVGQDSRCAGMLSLQAEAALSSGDISLAESSAAELLRIDPLLVDGWILHGYARLSAGDANAARADLQEARRINDLYPETDRRDELIDQLDAAIRQETG